MQLVIPTTYECIATGKGQLVDADVDTKTANTTWYHDDDGRVVLCIYIKGAPLKGRETHLRMSEEETEGIILQLQESLAKVRLDKARDAALARCRAGEASDDDRIVLARKSGSRMIGPDEVNACSHHEGETFTARWTWDTPTNERGASHLPRDVDAHRVALEGGGEPEYVARCRRCEATSRSRTRRGSTRRP